MATKKHIRIGAAAFAIGLALAGPQSVGLAAADGADSTADSAATTKGPQAEPDRGTVAAEETAPEVAAEENPSDPVEEPVVDGEEEESPVDEPEFVDPIEDPPVDETPVDETPVEPVVIVDPIEEPPIEEPLIDAPPTAEPPVDEPVVLVDPIVEDEPIIDDDTQGLPDPEVVDDPVIFPGRGGPDPLPWWRTGEGPLTEPVPMEGVGPVDNPEPVWLYDTPNLYPGADEEDGVDLESTSTPPTLTSATSAGILSQSVESLRVQVVAVIDQITQWLSGLPANPFAEFLSGALLLVRRALQPDAAIRSDTGDPGSGLVDTEFEPPDGLIGLTEDDAVQAAADAGWDLRIVSRDGEFFPVTKDYRLSRVNLSIANGVVTAAYRG